MFCSDCGKEIPEGSKFCSGCGKAVGAASNVQTTASHSDPAKILKQGEFRRIEKILDGMSKKNDGKLTLFCDRLEWRGRVNDDIKIDDIADVSVVYCVGNVGEKLLQITDTAGKVYKYYIVSTLLQRLNSQASNTAAAALSEIVAELERWRAAIDKVRGRL